MKRYKMKLIRNIKLYRKLISFTSDTWWKHYKMPTCEIAKNASLAKLAVFSPSFSLYFPKSAQGIRSRRFGLVHSYTKRSTWFTGRRTCPILRRDKLLIKCGDKVKRALSSPIDRDVQFWYCANTVRINKVEINCRFLVLGQ